MILKQITDQPVTSLDSETLKLIHDLELQRVELESQYEKLRHLWAQSEVANYKYTGLYDFTPTGYFMLSREGNIMELNLSGANMLGKDRLRLKSIQFSAFVTDATKHAFDLFLGKVFSSNTKKTCEVTLSTGGNLPMHVSLTGIAAGSGEQCFVTMIDISERKKAEEALFEREERLKDLTFIMADWVWEVDANGVYTYSSLRSFDLFGYSHEDVIGKTPFDFMPPDEANRIALIFSEIMAKKVPIKDLENWNIGKNGQRICLLTNAIPILDKEGNLKGYRGIDKDITKRKLSEEELEESREKYRGLSEAGFDSIFLSEKGLCIEQNQAAEKMFGYTNDEAIGRYGTDWIAPKDREMVMNNMISGVEDPYEATALKKDGTTFPCVLRGKMMHYKGKHVRVTSLTDVTDRKQAETKLIRLSRAVEQSPACIIITDYNGSIIYVNPKVCEITGYSAGEMVGKNPRILQSGETPKETYQNLWSTIISGNEWKGEFHNKKKNGELFWESVSVSPILDNTGKIINFLAVKEDITERKKMMANLEIAREKAESVNRLKTAFMNNISHEIRTPLNGILGFSQLITQAGHTEGEKDQFNAFIRASGLRLVNTVTSYMDISLITSGNMKTNVKPIELYKILPALYEQFEPWCSAKDLILYLNIPGTEHEITFCSDNELFVKAFSNILDNAVKFTAKGDISFGYTMKPGALEFFVKDTGIGIALEARERIFEAFTQENISSTRGYEGSGLGLSIAQGLIRLLGGEIRVESEQGRGAAFFFNLPFEETCRETNLPEYLIIKAPVLNKPVILIAEDDESNRFYLEKIINTESISVFLAVNGREAVELCRAHPEISMVLMDLKMPVMDGLEATREIKAFRADLPVIVSTAFAMEADKEKAIEAGCDEFLAKPVSKTALLNTLKKYGLVV